MSQILYKKIIMLVGALSCILPVAAVAAWPSSNTLLNTLAPVAGLDPDEVEAVRFSLKYPQCSSTIVSYTASQDYSLVGFIGTLKTSKLSNVPDITPLNKSNCKKAKPTQIAYGFIEDKGDELLGKDTASLLKKILADQIAQGQSEVDAQLASIPYIGTILTNWDCACDAAFETNFPSEVLVDETVGAVTSILTDIEKGNIVSATDKLFATFGSDATCKFLATQVGVQSIPIVNDVANSTCSAALGAPISFIVGGANDVAQALGIKGYDHISPDEYYKNYMASDIGVSNYIKKSDAYYTQCYAYFEPSSMSADTAKKVCILLRQRYLDESIAKIEWNQAKFEVVTYYNTNLKAKAAKSVFVTEDAFQKEILNQITICEEYFKNKFPNALTFAYASKQFCVLKDVENIMWESRKKAQQQFVSTIYPYTEPYCTYATPNQTALGCASEGTPLCQAHLTGNACIASKKYPNGVDVPCCKIDSSATPKSFIESKNATEVFAKGIDGGIYCKTNTPGNPLQISCSLKEAYATCQNTIGAESLKTCATTDQYKSGVYKYQCCEYTPEALDSVLSVKTAKNFVEFKNKQMPNSCALGGTTEGFGFDPRIVRCSTDAQVTQCKMLLYQQCSLNAQGYTTNGCCVKDPFGGSGPYQSTEVPPENRDTEDAPKKEKKSLFASLIDHVSNLVDTVVVFVSRTFDTKDAPERSATKKHSTEEPERMNTEESEDAGRNIPEQDTSRTENTNSTTTQRGIPEDSSTTRGTNTVSERAIEQNEPARDVREEDTPTRAPNPPVSRPVETSEETTRIVPERESVVPPMIERGTIETPTRTTEERTSANTTNSDSTTERREVEQSTTTIERSNDSTSRSVPTRGR